MTIKKNANGEENSVSYVPDPAGVANKYEIAYRLIRSEADLAHPERAPLRKVSIGPLGYLTVTEDDKKLVDDGLIVSNLTEADLGIITDQAGVLWFDRLKKADQASLTLRREDIPLPLYRVLHHK